ncbi:MAG: glycosyltransferase [Prosthecobacter sp.]|uniref:glycosyltransferase n=1 Tax=Prosthecobacter sp. TaxID=1965333 RepID=UPI0025CF0807|nr:glycosyltransferase [Prosthecobacter sp.]MCF7787387.1 glycosyltransferase [Prosthecobacter sp.]
MKKAKIVLLSDHTNGGAATLANMLASDIAQCSEYQIERWHFSPPAKAGLFTEQVTERSLAPSAKRPPLERLMKNFSRSLAARWRTKRHEEALYKAIKTSRPDLIHVHNIHSADLYHGSLLKIEPHIPLIWTIHDLWPIKGHACSWIEHTTGLRDRYEIGSRTRAALLRARDELLLQRRNLTLVAPSDYVSRVMRPLISRFKTREEMIPHVVRPEFLSAPSREASRAGLGFSKELFWLGVGATWNNNRKGMDVLWRALAGIDCRGLGLAIWGQEPEAPSQRGLTLRTFGSVSSPAQMAALYAAMDLFICPTKGDTGPLTVLESMAAGTPSLASRIGGIPERVQHGSTGLLFASQDAQALAFLIDQARCGNWPLEQMGQAARAYVHKNHAPELQAISYSRLYQRILSS